MLEAVRACYGAKGKSRWIREALEELLAEDRALQSVGVGEELAKKDSADVVDLGPELPARIQGAIEILRRQDPLMEGVQSAIIRAAIRRKLK